MPIEDNGIRHDKNTSAKYSIRFLRGFVILAHKVTDLVITDADARNERLPVAERNQGKISVTIRVVLSGYSDEDLVINIQRNSLAKRYLLKPWKTRSLFVQSNRYSALKESLKTRTC